MLDLLGASALAGFCSKVADEVIDRHLRFSAPLVVILAISYGLLLGWVSGQAGLSSLFLALALASLLSGKIDHPYHMLGAAAFAVVVFFSPLAGFMPWWFALFLLSGLLDELELGRGRVFAFMNEERLWTPLAVVLGVLALGMPVLFLMALLLFDLSFRFGGWIVGLEYPAQAVKKVNTPAKGKRKK